LFCRVALSNAPSGSLVIIAGCKFAVGGTFMHPQ
jgi:hypothetical protein